MLVISIQSFCWPLQAGSSFTILVYLLQSNDNQQEQMILCASFISRVLFRNVFNSHTLAVIVCCLGMFSIPTLWLWLSERKCGEGDGEEGIRTLAQYTVTKNLTFALRNSALDFIFSSKTRRYLLLNCPFFYSFCLNILPPLLHTHTHTHTHHPSPVLPN